MTSLRRTLFRCVALILICSLSLPSMAFAAPKPLTPEAVHKRILKRGVGNWVYIEEKNGDVFRKYPQFDALLKYECETILPELIRRLDLLRHIPILGIIVPLLNA